MKFLTVCWAGRVRSVTLANLLEEKGHEAIPVGISVVTPPEWRRLTDWADIIYVPVPRKVYNQVMAKLPGRLKKKVVFVDLKERSDIWRSVNHPDLVARLTKEVKELQ